MNLDAGVANRTNGDRQGEALQQREVAVDVEPLRLEPGEHSFIEQELNRARIGFRKNDNAFLAVDDVAALQAAADRLSPQIIRKQLDYWTFILGPKFSAKERQQLNLSRFYAIAGLEWEERGHPHHHRAENRIADVEIVVREAAALVGQDAIIWILARVFRHGDAKGGSLLHALEDEVDAVGVGPCHAALPGQDMVFLAHPLFGPL